MDPKVIMIDDDTYAYLSRRLTESEVEHFMNGGAIDFGRIRFMNTGLRRGKVVQSQTPTVDPNVRRGPSDPLAAGMTSDPNAYEGGSSWVPPTPAPVPTNPTLPTSSKPVDNGNHE
jgi:hypothetical protein